MAVTRKAREALPVATIALGAKCTIGSASGKEPIRIDSSRSVSGPAALLGDPEQKSLAMYIERGHSSGRITGRVMYASRTTQRPRNQ
jgi:branched-chain amino acid transport system substrate-binding protein